MARLYFFQIHLLLTRHGGIPTLKTGDSVQPDHGEVARRIRLGDVPAFDDFLKRNWKPLVGFLIPILGSVEDAQDVAQECFVRLWEQRSALRPDGSVRAYVYQIGRNLAINEVRSRALHRTLNERQSRNRTPVRTPGNELDSAELREVVEGAIKALPERRREAFVLAHLQNLPHREIAEIMGISSQTVANQISAALADLREALRPYIAETVDRGMTGTA